MFSSFESDNRIQSSTWENMFTTSSRFIMKYRWACNNANPFNRSSDILDFIYVLIHHNNKKFRSAVVSVVGNMI